MTEPVNNTTPNSTTDITSSSQTGTGAPAPVAPVSWINQDGTLKEGWQNSDLVPEDFRGRPVYNAVGKNVSDLMRHIGHQDIAISKQGKGIFVPGPDSNQTEKDYFYKAIGRPDKPEDYKIDLPKELLDETLSVEAKSIFHKAGLTQSQVNAIIAFDKARMEVSTKDLEENPVKYFEELLPKVEPIYAAKAAEELKKRWGDAYDSRMHLANRAIEEHITNPEDKKLFLSRAGNDPLVADLLATMMQKYATAGTGPDTSVGNATMAMNIDQRIDEMMRDPNYVDGRTNPGRHKSLVEEVNKLFAMKNK
jgi:hypothetical protein